MQIKMPTLIFVTGLAMAGAGCNNQESSQGAAVAPNELEGDPGSLPATPTAMYPATHANEPVSEPALDQQAKAKAKAESAEDQAEDAHDATELVKDARATLQTMQADPKLKRLLKRSSGVFIVPEYGRGAVGVGVRAGEGVLLAHHAGKWSDPVFYDVGGISLGVQLGAEGGEIAMILMGDEAVRSFKDDNAFSLNAGAKLTMVDYSHMNEANLGKARGRVIFWSNTKGAFAGASLSANNVSWDEDENQAYYGKPVTARDVLSGKVGDGKQGPLQQALSSL